MKSLFIILLLTVPVFSQTDDFIITEGIETEFAGKKILLQSIEYSASTIFARTLIDGEPKMFIEGDEVFSGQ